MYITPGQGPTTPREQNIDVNRKALSLCPFVASFKNISLFFIFFIHVYSPGAGADSPLCVCVGEGGSPDPWRLHMKFGFGRPSGFGEDVRKWWTTTDGRQSLPLLCTYKKVKRHFLL